MNFKRKEGFRFKFEEPIPMTFAVYENGRVNKEKMAMATLLDISPKGIKMFSEVDLGINPPPIEVRFILDTHEIRAYGEVIWVRPFAKGKQYGIFFNDQVQVEDLIVDELKARRKKEIAISKKNNL
ncbi:PilZ domain-containing protein [Lysinibacillus piscis]|uniref:PilZ domain-containing protein n=1 Tax=Lysinibacillus piscis TaxID=2518931 RepID=A0ABQ5NI81_9BACI|nr:PilZ domain-containing protein [Lysinibacillus sp. KH24]GLC87786.1 hypothetical protein LYSBPC_09130 [Lysinibacillus sp. KH24]